MGSWLHVYLRSHLAHRRHSTATQRSTWSSRVCQRAVAMYGSRAVVTSLRTPRFLLPNGSSPSTLRAPNREQHLVPTQPVVHSSASHTNRTAALHYRNAPATLLSFLDAVFCSSADCTRVAERCTSPDALLRMRLKLNGER